MIDKKNEYCQCVFPEINISKFNLFNNILVVKIDELLQKLLYICSKFYFYSRYVYFVLSKKNGQFIFKIEINYTFQQ